MTALKNKPGAGRPKGSKSAKTLAREAELKRMEDMLREMCKGQMFEGDSHAFLTMIYKCPEFPFDIRMDAAKHCLPFDRVRLTQNQLTNGDGEELSVSIIRFTDAPLPEQTEKKIPLRH